MVIFVTAAWVILSLLLGLVTVWAVWSRATTSYRLRTLIAFLIVLPVSAGAIAVSAGWSTPCRYMYGDYTIVGYSAIPEKVLYLFIETAYGPRVCDMPWSNFEYKKVREGLEKGGTGATMKGNSPFSLPGDPNIWNPPPEPALPPKEGV